MDTNTHDLRNLISASKLLKPQQRKMLLECLESLSPAQKSQLRAVLTAEPDPRDATNAEIIAAAAKRRDEEFFQNMDRLIGDASRAVRKAEEKAERSDDDSIMKHMLTD